MEMRQFTTTSAILSISLPYFYEADGELAQRLHWREAMGDEAAPFKNTKNEILATTTL